MPWLTADTVPAQSVDLTISLPDDEHWRAIVLGAILELTMPSNWEKLGSLTPEEMAMIWFDIFETVTWA